MIFSNLCHRSTYRLMIFLGLNHLITLTFAGPVVGVLAITGSTFCTAPEALYIMGVCGCGK